MRTWLLPTLCPASSVVALLVPAALFGQGGFNGPGRYEIANVRSQKVIDLDRNDRRTVIQFESRHTPNQTWEIRPARGGGYYLINGMDGAALEEVSNRKSSPVEGQRFDGGSRQVWRIESGPDGNAIIVSSSGMALDIPDGSRRDGAKVQVYNRNNDKNQQFVFRRTGRGGLDDGGPASERGRGRARGRRER